MPAACDVGAVRGVSICILKKATMVLKVFREGGLYGLILYTLWSVDSGLDISIWTPGRRWSLACSWLFATGCAVAKYRQQKEDRRKLIREK